MTRAQVLPMVFLLLAYVGRGGAQQAIGPFTVADEIGLTTFNDPEGYPPDVSFSPDGGYVALWAEHGDVKGNSVEDSLIFYRSADIRNFLEQVDGANPPSPAWVVRRSDRQARAINGWQWLRDSSAIVFLEHHADESQRLELADLRTKAVQPLSDPAEHVDSFDVADRWHSVYAATLSGDTLGGNANAQAPAVVGTGRTLYQLIFPEDKRLSDSSGRVFWAVVDGKKTELRRDGQPLDPGGPYALSPDGSSLVMELAIGDVPATWERLFPPPEPSSRKHIEAGRKDVRQYVRYILKSGGIEPLTDAPLAADAGWWWGGSGPGWSADGHKVVLPGTFIMSSKNAFSRPCVAVVDVASHATSWVETLKLRTAHRREEGYHYIFGAGFAPGSSKRVVVRFLERGGFDYGENEYEQVDGGAWKFVGRFGTGRSESGNLELAVKQGLDEPPVLIASTRNTRRVIWDPNPQLKGIALGEARVYTWKDQAGREVKGGLYLPANYKPGERYPLVIQTHGFTKADFIPSGLYPTGYAARELAAAGIMVLQAEDWAPGCGAAVTPDEGPCAASNYEFAVKQLASDGLIDPDRVGIIGFSRSCYYVIEVLTTTSLHVKAALISDGWMATYFQFMQWPERYSRDANGLTGAAPFGDGLQTWLKRSPGFNFDKVTAPLSVNAAGRLGLLMMWDPYSALHYLRKPVDLVVLNTDEHEITQPLVRMVSQQGSVDWFRFWLQGYQDPDPAKAEQYKRWRELRKLQAENEKVKSSARSEVPTRPSQ